MSTTAASSSLAADQPPKRPTVEHVADFVVQQLEAHRAKHAGKGRAPPLVVGVQGPQGSGKSYLASLLPSFLAAPSRGSLRTATLSLDDLYLPHSGLASVAAAHPGNALLRGRGQAGTHDLPLGREVLSALTAGGEEEVKIPVFEKSLHSGEGDRLPLSEWVRVARPEEVDVVVFEGWMLGFRPCASPSLAELYTSAQADPEGEATRQKLGIDYAPPFLLQHKLEDLQAVEDKLAEYTQLWDYVDCAVQIRPQRMGFVWEWRLEQEHNMKAKNGGIGMTDEQVKAFISRYMPGYEVWLKGLEDPRASWAGKGLRVVVDKGRAVAAIEKF
ncbi:hypothetical protein JCM10207_002548 [Rhodosporidiobolus poonsookiae]